MVAAIPEAVSAAEAAGGAAGGAAEGGAARAAAGKHARGRALPRAAAANREADRSIRVRGQASQRSTGRQTEGPGGGQRKQQSQSRRKTSRGFPRGRRPSTHSYQPVILAEFLTAVVLVAVSPLAKGGTPTSKAKGGASPYDVNTLKQLVAIGAAYFVLALLGASHRAGRYAAWFGGLVLLGVGFAQLASGDLQALFGIFGPSAAGGTLTPAQKSAADNAAQAVTGPGAVTTGPATDISGNTGAPGIGVV
jgi:hypothetical protein